MSGTNCNAIAYDKAAWQREDNRAMKKKGRHGGLERSPEWAGAKLPDRPTATMDAGLVCSRATELRTHARGEMSTGVSGIVLAQN